MRTQLLSSSCDKSSHCVIPEDLNASHIAYRSRTNFGRNDCPDFFGATVMVTKITGWGNDNTFDFVIEPGVTATGASSNNRVPMATGSAEGGPLVAWLSDAGVEVQFLDVLGQPLVAGAEVASRVNV